MNQIELSRIAIKVCWHLLVSSQTWLERVNKVNKDEKEVKLFTCAGLMEDSHIIFNSKTKAYWGCCIKRTISNAFQTTSILSIWHQLVGKSKRNNKSVTTLPDRPQHSFWSYNLHTSHTFLYHISNVHSQIVVEK